MHNNETREQQSEQEMNESSLDTCRQELQEWKEKYIHASADFANFKRRVEKDQAQWAINAQIRVVTPLLTIIDNFERAIAEKPETSDERVAAWVTGIDMINTDFQKFLQKFDIKEIPASGEFDPEYHEALMHVASDNHTSGTIVSVLEKGYMMGGTVLRVAKVSVSQ